MIAGVRVVIVLAACALVAPGGAKVRGLEPREVAAMQAAGKTVLFLDTRTAESSNRIPGSVHVPPDRIDAWAAGVDKAGLVVAYCT